MLINNLKKLIDVQDGHHEIYVVIDDVDVVSGDMAIENGQVVYAYIGVNNTLDFEVERGDKPVAIDELVDRYF